MFLQMCVCVYVRARTHACVCNTRAPEPFGRHYSRTASGLETVLDISKADNIAVGYYRDAYVLPHLYVPCMQAKT